MHQRHLRNVNHTRMVPKFSLSNGPGPWTGVDAHPCASLSRPCMCVFDYVFLAARSVSLSTVSAPMLPNIGVIAIYECDLMTHRCSLARSAQDSQQRSRRETDDKFLAFVLSSLARWSTPTFMTLSDSQFYVNVIIYSCSMLSYIFYRQTRGRPLIL